MIKNYRIFLIPDSQYSVISLLSKLISESKKYFDFGLKTSRIFHFQFLVLTLQMKRHGLQQISSTPTDSPESGDSLFTREVMFKRVSSNN